MGIFRIPDCPPIAAPLAGLDLFEVWDSSAQISSRITADQMAAFFGGGGGSQDLDSVLANGNTSGLTIQLEDTVAGTSTTYKSGGMESVGYIIDMIDGSFLIQGPQGLFNFDNSGNIVEIVDFDEFRYSYASSVVMSVNGAGQSVIFNTDSFSVGSGLHPNMFAANGIAGEVAFDIERFSVGIATDPEIILLDPISSVFKVQFGASPVFGINNQNVIFEVSSFSVGGASKPDAIYYDGTTISLSPLGGVGLFIDDVNFENIFTGALIINSSLGGNVVINDNGVFFSDSTGLSNLLAIDQSNDRLQAFAPIIATDSIGDYIKCETPSGPRAIRLDTII